VQTFKQFVEAREIKSFNRERDLYFQINQETAIKFSLICLEDLLTISDSNISSIVRSCINILNKWLKNQKSILEIEISSIKEKCIDLIDPYFRRRMNANGIVASYIAQTCDFIMNCLNAINNGNMYDYFIKSIIENATISFYYEFMKTHSQEESSKYFSQKRQQYKNKLKGMTTTRSGSPTSIEPLKGYDNTHFSIMAALDNLEEIGEIGKNHFVYQDDNGQWVFDLGHDNVLRAADREELAKEIHKDKYYLDALMRIYNNLN